MNLVIPKRVKELPVTSWTEWDSVELVKSAIREMEGGHFHTAANLVDAMTRDDRIEGCLLTRCGALPALPFNIDARGDARRAKSVAKTAGDLFEEMFPNAALEDLQKWGLMLGVALGELVWQLRPDGTLGHRLKVWHPRALEYRWNEECFYVQTVDGQVKVEPGNGQWLLYTPYGTERGWMRGRVRSLYVPWLVRQWGWRDWARGSEVWGSGIKKASVPAGGKQADKDRFVREVSQIAHESTVMLPRDADGKGGYDLELLESKGSTGEGFDRMVSKTESSIAINLLGQNLTTEVKGGSLAAAYIHATIRNDILRADGQNLALCLREQALKPWARFNYGDPELAPLPAWKTDPPEDKKAKGDAMKAAGDGIRALKAIGAKPDVDAILEDSGVPTTGKAEDVKIGPDGNAPEAAGAKEDEKPTKTSRRPEPKKTGAIAGQLYADELSDRSVPLGAKALAPDLETLLSVIKSAKSYDDLRGKLVKAYGQMDRARLADLLEKAIVLADLAGKHAVLEDL